MTFNVEMATLWQIQMVNAVLYLSITVRNSIRTSISISWDVIFYISMMNRSGKSHMYIITDVSILMLPDRLLTPMASESLTDNFQQSPAFSSPQENCIHTISSLNESSLDKDFPLALQFREHGISLMIHWFNKDVGQFPFVSSKSISSVQTGH